MNNYIQFFSGLAVMAGVTYLVRMLPLVLVKKKIENRFINSFLYYVPYAVLAVMTVPAIFSSTASLPSAIAGFVVDSRIFRARSADRRRRVLRRRVHSGADNEIHSLR